MYTYKLWTKQSDTIFTNIDLKVIGKAMPGIKQQQSNQKEKKKNIN